MRISKIFHNFLGFRQRRVIVASEVARIPLNKPRVGSEKQAKAASELILRKRGLVVPYSNKHSK